MDKIAVIGAGISGLSIANILQDKGNSVVVYEKESTPGGLIRCKRIEGSLFHICGGHVFNSKRKDVLDWFWSKINKSEWIRADRNSVVLINDEKSIPYPIENHFYLWEQDIQKEIIKDLVEISKNKSCKINNFEEFLQCTFGRTLYNLYFEPYNKKIWRRSLQQVPISWLEGKLPTPNVEEILLANINHLEERQFVHSSFWYEKYGGSQFIADQLSQKLKINYNSNIRQIKRFGSQWCIQGEIYDSIIFCGNIKDLPQMLPDVDLSDYKQQIDKLEYHGTTSVFCEIDANPYSWIYLPSERHDSHRIICTGNFAQSNNAIGKMTGTVEFTDEISINSIKDNLSRIPLNPKYITHHYNQFTYPIQDANTRNLIKELKSKLEKFNIYFTGRFADWEYYNMDIAIGAALDLSKQWK